MTLHHNAKMKCFLIETENLNIILESNIYYIFSVTASYYITLKHTKVQSICFNWRIQKKMKFRITQNCLWYQMIY